MRLLLLPLLILFGLVACSEQADAPKQQQTIRIVSLSPAATDILIDLGCADAIVGRHNYETQLDASVPAVGDQSAIDYEQLLALRPTHVIVQTESQPVPTRLLGFAESAPFEIINVSSLSLGDVLATTRMLEERFAPDAGLADRFAQAIRPRPPAASDIGSVLVAMYCSPTVDVLGPGSAHQEIIELLGYTPVLETGRPYMPLDAEDVLALDPGVIVLVQPRAVGRSASSSRPTIEQMGILSGLDLDAVSLGRVILIDDPQALTSGTSLIGVIEQLEQQLGSLSSLGSQHDDDQDADNGEARPG